MSLQSFDAGELRIIGHFCKKYFYCLLYYMYDVNILLKYC